MHFDIRCFKVAAFTAKRNWSQLCFFTIINYWHTSEWTGYIRT